MKKTVAAVTKIVHIFFMPDGELQVVMVPVWGKKKVLFTNLQILV